MELPDRITLTNSRYFMDGGTTQLRCEDGQSNEHTIMLVQRMMLDGRGFGIPGRLYFDDEPIGVR